MGCNQITEGSGWAEDVRLDRVGSKEPVGQGRRHKLHVIDPVWLQDDLGRQEVSAASGAPAHGVAGAGRAGRTVLLPTSLRSPSLSS